MGSEQPSRKSATKKRNVMYCCGDGCRGVGGRGAEERKNAVGDSAEVYSAMWRHWRME